MLLPKHWWHCLLVACLGVGWSHRAAAASLPQLFGSAERAVSVLLAQANASLLSDCAFLGNQGGLCSWNACSRPPASLTPFQTCSADIGTPSICKPGSGSIVSNSRSNVQFPGSNQSRFELDSWRFAGMDVAFEQNSRAQLSPARQFVVSQAGVLRQYPAAAALSNPDACEPFDAQLQPWYSNLISGSTTIVLLLDLSAAMETEVRFTAMRDAVSLALSSLAVGDQFAVLGFDESLLTRYPASGLTLATSVAVTEAKEWLRQLEATRKTNRYLTTIFNATFELLGQHEAEAPGCNPVVLLFAGGPPSDNLATASLSDMQQNRRRLHRAPVLVFTFGIATPDASVLQQIACENDGAYHHIDGSSPAVFQAAVLKFRQFLAANNDSNINTTSNTNSSSSIVWYGPSSDSHGQSAAPIVVASAAVRDAAGLVQAVVGVELLASELATQAGVALKDLEQFVAQQDATRRCTRLLAPSCVLESIRPEQHRCGISSCPANPDPTDTCTDEQLAVVLGQANTSVICQSQPYSDMEAVAADLCCDGMLYIAEDSTGKHALTTALIGVVLTAFIVASCIILAVSKCRHARRRARENSAVAPGRVTHYAASPVSFNYMDRRGKNGPMPAFMASHGIPTMASPYPPRRKPSAARLDGAVTQGTTESISPDTLPESARNHAAYNSCKPSSTSPGSAWAV